MSETARKRVHFNPAQVRRLHRAILHLDDAAGLTVEQDDRDRIVATSPSTGQRWTFGVRGGG